MATHLQYSIFLPEIRRTEEPVRLQSMGSQDDMTENNINNNQHFTLICFSGTPNVVFFH